MKTAILLLLALPTAAAGTGLVAVPAGYDYIVQSAPVDAAFDPAITPNGTFIAATSAAGGLFIVDYWNATNGGTLAVAIPADAANVDSDLQSLQENLTQALGRLKAHDNTTRVLLEYLQGLPIQVAGLEDLVLAINATTDEDLEPILAAILANRANFTSALGTLDTEPPAPPSTSTLDLVTVFLVFIAIGLLGWQVWTQRRTVPPAVYVDESREQSLPRARESYTRPGSE